MHGPRRQVVRGLGAALAAALAPRRAVSAVATLPRTPSAAASAMRVVAAWDDAGQYRVGLLALTAGAAVQALASIEVPTRAHGVGVDARGAIVAVARRPGDWLLRWAGPGHAAQWGWAEPQRAFNGHALLSPDGRRLFTTETDLDSGAGLVGVRDATSFQKLDEWATQGVDPHQLLWDRRAPGQLLVANGGIHTAPETGRAKLSLPHMDSSLVRLDARGTSTGQWRLADARLSLRHIAFNHDGSRLGIALQAEHDDLAVRQQAPVLAVFDGQRLSTVPAGLPLAGYGGDIAALGDGFAVACPRANGVALFAGRAAQPAAGRESDHTDTTVTTVTTGNTGNTGNTDPSDHQLAWQRFVPLAEACALAAGDGAALWVGGRPAAACLSSAKGAELSSDLNQRRLDNHWCAAGASIRKGPSGWS